MTRGEKRGIQFLLIVIILLAIILVYKIKVTPKHDQKLYDEIYQEYEEIITSVEKQNDNNQNAVKTDNNIYIMANSRGNEYRVAGKIYIPKINISYPIVYETTDEYLKIAPSKLFGPEINEIGNVCIVGHNYNNDEFFSRLSELEINDKIYLMNNKGEELTYLVYDKYEVDEKDMSCTSQETNGNIEATLITCTTKKRNRMIIKCRVVK